MGRQRTCRVCRERRDSSEFLKRNPVRPQRNLGFCAECRRRERRKHPQTPKTMRDQLFLLADGLCSYCDASLQRGWHVDHVNPRNLGGVHALENLVAACPTCNADHLSDIQVQLRRLRARGVPSWLGAAWYDQLEALQRLGIREAATFWERRCFVQDLVRGRARYRHRGVPSEPSPIESVRRRVAHLSDAAKGTPEHLAPRTV